MNKIKPLVHPILINIVERFPQYNETVRDLFRTNQSFNEICRDYSRCYKTLQYWKTQLSEEALQRSYEYREILQGLEQEILQHIKERQDVGRNRNMNHFP